MPLLPFPTRSTVALVAVGDPSRDRTVYATIVLLVALGFTMIMLAVWLLRNTRPDPEVLAPLERMGQRRWRRADPVWQRRHLDEVRPGGADPLEPIERAARDGRRLRARPAADRLRRSRRVEHDHRRSGGRAPSAIGRGGRRWTGRSTSTHAGDVPSAERRRDATESRRPTAPSSTTATDDAPRRRHADDDGDDDDEDITGEQDTDDFLAVLDEVTNSTPTSILIVEPEVEPSRRSRAEPVEPDVDPDASTSRKPIPIDEVEPEADADADAGGRARRRVRADVEPESIPSVEPEADRDVRSDVEPDVDDRDDDEPG